MSYIGNQVTSIPHVINTFSGNALLTSFGPLIRAPAGTAAIAVFISGVYKTPGIDYTLDGDYINFVSAPPNGADNIVVHHLGNGSASQTPSDGSVTGTKLAQNIIRANNIVAGQITGNLIATGVITGNLIGTGAITGNLIGINAVNASNTITSGSITGNLIGIGAISANNFAGGGITSNVLASNLSISLTRAFESANINGVALSGTYDIHAANNVVYYFNANTTGNVTFNLRANTQNIFDSITTVGQSSALAIILKHGSTRHSINLQIDGVTQTLFYAGQTAPTYRASLTQQEINVVGFDILKTAANSYTVLVANTLYKAI